jgi:Frog skin active peptide family signal and propeptide
MKKLLFALLFMTTVSLSFCKQKECTTTSTDEERNSSYIETDSLSAFKGQNTLSFTHKVSFVTSNDVGCGHGGCIHSSLKVLNLTNKTVKIKVFADERAILYNQPYRTILMCLPNTLLNINDASLGFLGCTSDLSKLIQVSYQ